MTTSTKVKSFVKSFEAIIKGDDAKAQAQKTLRQADHALKSQIASLNGDTIDFETDLEKALEKQGLARVNNGRLIDDRKGYVTNLLLAKNAVIEAESALETHKEKIAFLESELKALDEEVEA